MKTQTKGLPSIMKPFPDRTVKTTGPDKLKGYSEKELVQFRKVIIDKLDEATKNNELLKHTISHADNTSPAFKIREDGSDIEAKERATQLSLRQEILIQNLKNALIRIEHKTYGICSVTGRIIPKERLLSVPHTNLSIEAKLKQQFS